MRQIAGVFSQLEKARLVGKLKAARDRKRLARRSRVARVTLKSMPETMMEKWCDWRKKLRRKSPKGGRRSLRLIASELEKVGFVSQGGKRFAATAIARMLGEL